MSLFYFLNYKIMTHLRLSGEWRRRSCPMKRYKRLVGGGKHREGRNGCQGWDRRHPYLDRNHQENQLDDLMK
jgi:hypothetical protein